MLRVLSFSTRYPSALLPGVGNFVESQLVALSERPGVEVEVLAPVAFPPFPIALRPRHRRKLALPREEMRKGLRVHRPRFTAVPWVPQLRVPLLTRALLPAIRDIHRRFPFDLILAEFSWPEGPTAIRLGRALGLRVAVKARGMDFLRRSASPATRRDLLAACREADALLAVSEGLRAEMIARGVAGNRITVHYPGLDQSRFFLGDRAGAKRRLGLTGPLLLSVGNLIPEKAQHLAVRALALLDEATLMIVGNGPERPNLLRLARNLGVRSRLIMPGHVPNEKIADLYSAADLLIHPSTMEGFANVRIEALACGTPIVTTAVGGAKELIDRYEAGRIVAPTAEAIAAAVADMLASRPSPAAAADAARRFSWERNAIELEEVLRPLSRASSG